MPIMLFNDSFTRHSVKQIENLTLNRPGFLKPSTAGGGRIPPPLCKTLPESPMILKFGTVIDHHKLYSKI